MLANMVSRRGGSHLINETSVMKRCDGGTNGAASPANPAERVVALS